MTTKPTLQRQSIVADGHTDHLPFEAHSSPKPTLASRISSLKVAVVLAFSIVIGIALGLSPLLYFGSGRAMHAWISGHSAFLDVASDPVVGNRGEKVTVVARVWNFTARPIAVLGVKSTCGCLTCRSVPTELPARRCVSAEFELSAERAGKQKYEIEIYLDDPAVKRCTATVPVHIKG